MYACVGKYAWGQGKYCMLNRSTVTERVKQRKDCFLVTAPESFPHLHLVMGSRREFQSYMLIGTIYEYKITDYLYVVPGSMSLCWSGTTFKEIH